MARGETHGDRGAGASKGEPVAVVAISPSAAYVQHADALRAFLTGSTRDAAAAEDLVHETFIRLLTETAEGRAPIHLRGWLFRVGSNLAASRGRRRGVAARRNSELTLRAVAPSPEDELLDREAAEALHGRIAQLPEHVRTALLMSAQGYTGREIADHLGRSQLAIRSMLCRYRGRLRGEAAAA